MIDLNKLNPFVSIPCLYPFFSDTQIGDSIVRNAKICFIFLHQQ